MNKFEIEGKRTNFYTVSISILAIVISILTAIYTVSESKKISSSDYYLSEQVKKEIVEIVTTLRTIMIKSMVYSVRSDEPHISYEKLDLNHEKEILNKFLSSSTSLAIQLWIMEQEKNKNIIPLRSSTVVKVIEDEDFYIFHTHNTVTRIVNLLVYMEYDMSRVGYEASSLYDEFVKLKEKDYKEIYLSVRNLPKTLEALNNIESFDYIKQRYEFTYWYYRVKSDFDILSSHYSSFIDKENAKKAIKRSFEEMSKYQHMENIVKMRLKNNGYNLDNF